MSSENINPQERKLNPNIKRLLDGVERIFTGAVDKAIEPLIKLMDRMKKPDPLEASQMLTQLTAEISNLIERVFINRKSPMTTEEKQEIRLEAGQLYSKSLRLYSKMATEGQRAKLADLRHMIIRKILNHPDLR